MRSRTEMLKDLVLLQGNIESLEKDLSNFPWDSEMPLYSISIEDLSPFVGVIAQRHQPKKR